MSKHLLAAALLFVAGCPADPPISGDTSEETAETGNPADTTAAAPTTGGTTTTPTTGDLPGTASTGTSAAETGPDSAGSTGTGPDTADTTGGLDDTGGSSTAPAETTGGETTADSTTGETGDESTTGECDEPGAPAEATAMKLEDAVAGVLYSSEGDHPWTVQVLACAPAATTDNIKELIADTYMQHDDVPLADRVVELETFEHFFDRLTVPKDWWDDGYYEQMEKYLPIREILEDELTDLQVFRLGEQSGNVLSGAIDVYVVGRSGEDLVAIATISIET